MCGSFGWILGGYQELGKDGFVTRTYANLPTHDQLRLQLRYVKIDSWDTGEKGIVDIDGNLIWSAPLKSHVGDGSSCECGNTNFGCSHDKVWQVDSTMNHTASTATIMVTSNLDSTAHD